MKILKQKLIRSENKICKRVSGAKWEMKGEVILNVWPNQPSSSFVPEEGWFSQSKKCRLKFIFTPRCIDPCLKFHLKRWKKPIRSLRLIQRIPAGLSSAVALSILEFYRCRIPTWIMKLRKLSLSDLNVNQVNSRLYQKKIWTKKVLSNMEQNYVIGHFKTAICIV